LRLCHSDFYGVWKYRTSHCIKFSFTIGKTATETHQLLQQSYGEDAMGRTQVFDWFRRFKEGRTTVQKRHRSGRLSTSRNEEMTAKVRKIFRNNRRLTVRKLEDSCEISVGSCDEILTADLHMKLVCTKFVLLSLRDDQREQRQTIARDLFERSCEDVQFLQNIETGDESWVYEYDPKTKRQSSQWKSPTSPRPNIGPQMRSKTKDIFLAFLVLRVSYTTSAIPTDKKITRNSTWRSCDFARTSSPKMTGKMARW